MKLRRAPYKTRPKLTRRFLLSTALTFFLCGFYAHAEEQVSGFSRPWLYSFIETHGNRLKTEVADRVVGVGLYGSGDEQAVERARVILWETVNPDVFRDRIRKLSEMPETFGGAETSAEEIDRVLARINEILEEIPVELEKAAAAVSSLKAGHNEIFPSDFGEALPFEGMVEDGLRSGRLKAWDYMWQAVTAAVSLQSMQMEWRALQIAYPEGALDVDTSFEDDAQKLLDALVHQALGYKETIKEYEDRFPDGTFISKPLPEGPAYRMAREIDEYGRILRMRYGWTEYEKDQSGKEQAKASDPALWLWLFEQEPALTEISRLVCVAQSLLIDKGNTVSEEASALLTDYHAKAKPLVEQAETLMAERRFTEANDLLLQAMAYDPGNPQTMTLLYESTSQSGDMTLAAAAFRFLWANQPEQKFDYLPALNTALSVGDWELLMSVSLAALREDPKSPENLYFFAMAAYSWNLMGYEKWASRQLGDAHPLQKDMDWIDFGGRRVRGPSFDPNPANPEEQLVAELWEIASSEAGFAGLGTKLFKADDLQRVAAAPHIPAHVRAFAHRIYVEHNRFGMMKYGGVRRDDVILFPIDRRKIDSPYSAYDDPMIVLGKDRLERVLMESPYLPKNMGYAVDRPPVAIEKILYGTQKEESVKRAIQKIDASYLAYDKNRINQVFDNRYDKASDQSEREQLRLTYAKEMLLAYKQWNGDFEVANREILEKVLPLIRKHSEGFGQQVVNLIYAMSTYYNKSLNTVFLNYARAFSPEEKADFKIAGSASVIATFTDRYEGEKKADVLKIYTTYPPGSKWFAWAHSYARAGDSFSEVKRKIDGYVESEAYRREIIEKNKAIASRNAARARERAESFERWNNAAIAQQQQQAAQQTAQVSRGYQPRQRGYTWTGKAEVWSSQSSSWSSQQSGDYKADTYRRQLNQQINRAMGGY